VDTPASAIEKRTSPPRAWRGLEIARRFPASNPYEGDAVDAPDIVEAKPVPPPGPAATPDPDAPASDAGPPALRGEALARALEALR
jgi:hypothetical protein